MAITDSRVESAVLESAYTIRSVNQLELLEKSPRNLPEALNQIPGVLVQKTANGQGSPFIRGFTGYRTLALIDGVRYNNSVYRDGPNEYFSLIDIGNLSSIDLYSGPTSSLFGSDAIGGTLNLVTKSSQFLEQEPSALFWYGSTDLRYSTAEHSFSHRNSLDIGQGEQWGLLASFSRKNFGDVDAADLGRLKQTGYDEYGLDLRFDLVINAHSDLTAVHQSLEQDDVWRTHATVFSQPFAGTIAGTDLKRLKDQKRQLNYITLRHYHLHQYIDQATLTVSHQRWLENGDRIRESGRRIIDFFESNMYGIDLQLDSDLEHVSLTYGVDYYRDNVNSGRTEFLANGDTDRVRIQGPIGDDAHYGIFGSYLSAKFNLTEQLQLNISSRYSYVKANIGQYEDPNTQLAASFHDDWDNFSSAIRLSYDLMGDQTHTLWTGLSQSFRAPNIADLSRFGSSRSNETEIAAANLSPETFLTYEMGYQWHLDRLDFSATYYYTQIDDFIASTPTGNIVDGLVEVSKQNSADGFIHGLEFDTQYRINDNLSFRADLTWLGGRLTRTDFINGFTHITEPFSRIMPLTVNLGLKWYSNNRQWWLGSDVTLAAKADKLSEGDASDEQRIPPGGTPSYQWVNLYSGWQLTPDLLLTLQINNLFDEAYRSHGSGSNEPGRNYIVGSTIQF